MTVERLLIIIALILAIIVALVWLADNTNLFTDDAALAALAGRS